MGKINEEKKIKEGIKIDNGYGRNKHKCIHCKEDVNEDELCIILEHKEYSGLLVHIKCFRKVLNEIKEISNYSSPYYPHNYLTLKKAEMDYEIEDNCIACDEPIIENQKYIEMKAEHHFEYKVYLHNSCTTKLEKITDPKQYSSFIASYSLSDDDNNKNSF